MYTTAYSKGLHELRKITYLTLLLVAAFSCYGEHTIRIAFAGPFTGTYSAYGTQLLSGAAQAVNDINSKGGLKGIKLEIIPVDDQCDPDLAVKQAASIVENKSYHAIIGHVCSAATLATGNIYAKANILVITPTSTNSKITERNISTIFRMTGTDQQQSATAANFIANTLKSKRIAILHDQELYSKDLADMVSEQLLQLGTTPVLYQGVTRGTCNFTPIIKKLKALNADAVYFAGLYPEVSALAKTLNVLELQIPLITADGIALNKFISNVGSPKIAGSVLMTFADNPRSIVSSQALINKMHNSHLETTGYALYAYAAVEVIAQAIDSTNTTDGRILASWLHQHEVNTVLGKKSWDTNGDIINSQFNIYTLTAENHLE
jgi:branched-chain amino acid transport system substrate-binding protein